MKNREYKDIKGKPGKVKRQKIGLNEQKRSDTNLTYIDRLSWRAVVHI